jgi:hypothetical protein
LAGRLEEVSETDELVTELADLVPDGVDRFRPVVGGVDVDTERPLARAILDLVLPAPPARPT